MYSHVHGTRNLHLSFHFNLFWSYLSAFIWSFIVLKLLSKCSALEVSTLQGEQHDFLFSLMENFGLGKGGIP